MKKRIRSLIAGVLLAGSTSAFSCGEIIVTGVVDGDTLRAEMVGMPDNLKKVSIRIMGIDTPEIHGKCDSEKEKAREAKEFLRTKLLATRAVTFKWMEWDKYGGRILAEVYFDGEDVSKLMIDSGLAVEYHGEKKSGHWCLTTSQEP